MTQPGSPGLAPERDKTLVCLARQAILDDRGRVFGYELLYRADDTATGCETSDDSTSARVLTGAVSALGLDLLTGGRPAFLNFTKRLLLEGATLLPPASMVIELHESVPADADVMDACRDLADAGYAIGLDDYVPGSDADALLPIAKFVKVDVLQTTASTRAALVERLTPLGVRLIAEKVETADMAERTRREGYRLFQGYYFVRPVTFSGRTVPGDSAANLRLLGAVNRTDISLAQLEDLVKGDVSLCHRVLGSINSSAFALRREISSIREALVLLGRDRIRTLASVWVLSRLNGQGPSETLSVSLIRAGACQRLGDASTLTNGRTDLFLLGLCSALDAIVGRPLSEVLSALPLSAHIADALLGRPSDVRPVLDAAIAYERGRWDEAAQAAAQVGIAPARLADAYNEALRWTRTLSGLVSAA